MKTLLILLLTATSLAAAQPVPAPTHGPLEAASDHGADPGARMPAQQLLWDENQRLQKTLDLPVLKDLRFSVIKPYEFAKDGYRFLHGVAICFHRGKLFASFGHNRGAENTASEQARYCVSEDDGRTWSPVETIASGEPGVGISHGALISHHGRLWAFAGAYRGTMQDVHTRAYVLNETSDQWLPKGTVISGGFWPMQAPIKMDDGNWIMAGIAVRGDAAAGGRHPAAVAITHGDDWMKWDLIELPAPRDMNLWGESTVIVQGRQVINISRFGSEPRALVSRSEDYGRSWTMTQPSNLPMATSKPYAGTLSSGHRYLICTTTADSGKRRAPLTIALMLPGEQRLSKIFVIRHAEFPAGPGESHARASLSYPYAIEHEGHLYVGYSNNGGNAGRIGEGRQLWNNNSGELAVIPLTSLVTP